MPTRNVVLTDHQAATVDGLVATGRHQNASEERWDGRRIVEGEEAKVRARMKALRGAAREGIADAETGRIRSFGTGAQLSAHLRALADEELGTPRRRAK